MNFKLQLVACPSEDEVSPIEEVFTWSREDLSLTLALCSPGKCLLPDMQLVARNFEQDGVARGVVKTSFGP